MIRTEIGFHARRDGRLRRKIMQHEIEGGALKKENDQLSPKSICQLRQRNWPSMRDQFKAMKAQWENEKPAIGRVQKLREEIEQVNADIDRAEQEYDLNKAAELKYGRLPQLQKELEASEQARGRRRAKPACCATRSPTRRSPRSWPGGPASRWPS